MARFFNLPIARRLAEDPPSLELFAQTFLKYQNKYPLRARAFFHRCSNNIHRSWQAPAEGLTFTPSSKILSDIAEFCAENNATYYRAQYDTFIQEMQYEDIINGLNSDASDHDSAVDFLNEHFNVMECTDCGDSYPSEDMHSSYDDSICSHCKDRNYSWSSYEDTYIHNDYVREAIDRRGNNVLIHEDNSDFSWDEDDDTYYHNEYNREEQVIKNYHSSKYRIAYQHDDWTRKHKRFFGVELEVECEDGDRAENAKLIHDRVNVTNKKMFFENDGSLRNGFEMITQPTSLPGLRELFKFLNEKHLIKNLKSHNTTTCGLHVHVSRTGMTDLQIGKIVSFINNPNHEWFIRTIARRYASGFCQIKEKTPRDCRSGDRYEAVNLTNRETIEFRMFKGSLKYESVISAVEFCHAIVEFTRPSVAGIRDLNVSRFLSFCRTELTEETKILRKYIESRSTGRSVESEAA